MTNTNKPRRCSPADRTRGHRRPPSSLVLARRDQKQENHKTTKPLIRPVWTGHPRTTPTKTTPQTTPQGETT